MMVPFRHSHMELFRQGIDTVPDRPEAGTGTDAHVPTAEPRAARSDGVQLGRRKGLRRPHVVDFQALQAL